MKNLKPCPCCGGAAHMITHPQIGNLSGDDGFISTIKCLGGGDCGLEVSAWALKKAWAIESVTKKWNRRVNAEVPRWIPVTERLPDFHEEVLIYAIGKEDGFSPVVAISEIYIFRLLPFSNGTIEWRDPWDFFSKNYEVTHWMPLPNAPEVDG